MQAWDLVPAGWLLLLLRLLLRRRGLLQQLLQALRPLLLGLLPHRLAVGLMQQHCQRLLLGLADGPCLLLCG
jgi:hypothetical protein